MEEIDLSIRNSKYYVIWFKLIWQKKKMLWLQIMNIFFYSAGESNDIRIMIQ